MTTSFRVNYSFGIIRLNRYLKVQKIQEISQSSDWIRSWMRYLIKKTAIICFKEPTLSNSLRNFKLNRIVWNFSLRLSGRVAFAARNVEIQIIAVAGKSIQEDAPGASLKSLLQAAPCFISLNFLWSKRFILCFWFARQKKGSLQGN